MAEDNTRNTVLEGTEELRKLIELTRTQPVGGWADFPLPTAPAAPNITGVQQGEMRSDIIQLARKMKLTGWGAHGSATGFTEVVPYRRVWINPGYPVEYTEQEIRSLALAIARDGQREPVVVVAARDPRPQYPEGDGTGGDLMIVDGVRRYKALPRAGIDEVGVIVQPYANYYAAVTDTVSRKISQMEHPLSDVEIGKMIVWMRIAHNLSHAADPNLHMFPTQLELAAMLGRSQGATSTWCRLAQMPESMLERIMDGTLNQAQEAEPLPLPPHEQERLEEQAAEAEADAGSRGDRQMPGSDVGQMTEESAVGHQADWAIPVVPVPSGLWLESLRDEQLPRAVARLAHDLALCLAAAESNSDPYLHPSFVALRKTLSDPEMQRHIQSVGAPKN